MMRRLSNFKVWNGLLIPFSEIRFEPFQIFSDLIEYLILKQKLEYIPILWHSIPWSTIVICIDSKPTTFNPRPLQFKLINFHSQISFSNFIIETWAHSSNHNLNLRRRFELEWWTTICSPTKTAINLSLQKAKAKHLTCLATRDLDLSFKMRKLKRRRKL